MFKPFEHKRNENIGAIVSSVLFFTIAVFLFLFYSISLSSLVLIAVLALYMHFFYSKKNLPSVLDMVLLLSLALLIIALTKVTSKLPPRLLPYAVSAIGFSILITMLFDDLQLSIFFSLIISTLAASSQIGDSGLAVSISLFSASIVAAMLSFRVRTRFRIIRAGLLAGAIQFAVAFIAQKGEPHSFLAYHDMELLKVCLLNGTISGVVVGGILPVFEYIFRVVTNISLLELSDFNHPIMKMMILEAPGTYQHSLVVANLGEAAAEAIGANPLLVRVGSYYHDIGKIPKAHYFVENQIPYRDSHKDLKPSISKMIIINHVKEGVDLAKKHRLNPKIINFIVQHHGKSLVYYFYHRARELEPEREDEEEYRYPGPRPQSKEVAIVALADTIEALSRTLEEPTPARIKEMVQEVVRKKFIEGELDESDLTLKDLEKITESFVRILNAIFHTRVNYPQNGTNKKPAKSQDDQSE
ncbi:MAG: HDIG domain-containing metalloprotein [Candidatus Omnitrophota bacterium]